MDQFQTNKPITLLTYNPDNELKWPNKVYKGVKWLESRNSDNDSSEDIVEKFNVMSNINRVRCKKTDREEIRRRLATGFDDDYYNGERLYRKPSLQSRLQSGMNLQICFMNETSSDNESLNSDSEISDSTSNSNNFNEDKHSAKRPGSLPVKKCHADDLSRSYIKVPSNASFFVTNQFRNKLKTGAEFYTSQVKLQAEAKQALAQAKELAHLQMEFERQRCKVSPITDMIRKSLEKVGISFPNDRRRLSRQILTEMNIAQLQIIANDLHTKIEILNEQLVRLLITRDDLHMEQDSMLVDIEDITRYLDANRSAI